jgi:chondroitin AC lyase
LEGFRYYPYSDFAAYQCKHFGFFLKTISTRGLPAESINGENLKGHLLNSGDGYLIHNGHEYFNLLPLWDRNALPGITSFRGAEQIIRKAFAGSVSDHKNGLTAMNDEMQGLKAAAHVYAHKICACHDGKVICLIAGLSAPQVDENIFTVLDQCRWQGAVTVNASSHKVGKGVHTLQNVKWVHQGTFAYIPLKPAAMRLLSDTVSGTWSSISTSASDSLLTDSVFMSILLHGAHPQNLSTGYVLAYAASAKQAALLAEHPT